MVAVGLGNLCVQCDNGGLESTQEAKQRLRATAKQQRSAAFARHGPMAAQHLAEVGLAFASVTRETIVSGFSAISDELDPLPLLNKLISEGHPACLPVIQGRG